jgi:protein arginine kinase activator
VFRKALLPLLERVHDASSHRGRCPGKPARMADADDKLAGLRLSLRDAINAENYELAASLRDKIQTLTGQRDDEEPPA